MAKQLTPQEIAAILAHGTFDDLVGCLEDEHLECKAAPYQLQPDHQKYELAKDVSCIANRSSRTGSEGCHILLGVRTEKSPEYHQDMVVEISPFEQAQVNLTVYYQVLDNWLLPMPEGIDIRWHASAGDPARGIVAITIPRQPSDRWPIIINRVVEDSGTVRGSWIAYFERRGEHAVPLAPADLQRLLRDGQRSDTLSQLSQRVDALSDQVRMLQERQQAPVPPAGPSEAFQSYRQRRNRAMDAAGLLRVPVFALTAAPLETVSLPTLFRSASDPLVQLLAQPPELRVGGFDLQAGDPEIVPGQPLRRALIPGHLLLECWLDGTLIFVAEASDYLCWGMRGPAGGMLRLNPMALAESTYLFATLAQRIHTQHTTPQPETVEFGLMLYNMEGGGQRAVLAPGPLKSTNTRLNVDLKQAPAATHEIPVRIATPWTPGLVAYQLVCALYIWLGFDEEDIPYVVEENGARVISYDSILADAD